MSYLDKSVRIKLSLYILSLWVLIVSIVIFTIEIPVYFGKDWCYIGTMNLLRINILPASILCLYTIGYIASTHCLKTAIEGTQQLSVTISNTENISSEHLVYLATYIIPLICFDFSNNRHVFVLCFLLVVIGIIYNKVDMFYANPMLSLFNYKIYKLEYNIKGTKSKKVIAITKDILSDNDSIKYICISSNVYYAKKVNGERTVKKRTLYVK